MSVLIKKKGRALRLRRLARATVAADCDPSRDRHVVVPRALTALPLGGARVKEHGRRVVHAQARVHDAFIELAARHGPPERPSLLVG